MLPILCYHKVGPVEVEGRALNVEPALLDAHVRFFRRRGFTFMRARDLGGSWPDRAVCLTFDDAYVSALTLGCEILTDHEVTATFYAVPSLAGGSSEWDGDRARPLASWETLLQAQRLGFEIGNHTWSHPDLSALGKPDQLQQWTRADEALREHGLEPGSCCYPYGRMNSDSVDAVRLSGASVAVAIKKRRAKPDDDRLALPRIVIAYSDSMPKLLYKMYVRPLLP